jgi:hypothetical protein
MHRPVANRCPASENRPSPEARKPETALTVRPPAMPITTWLRGNGTDLGRRGLEFFEQCEQTAGLVRIRVWHKTAYIASDPACIEQILRSQLR